jgi:hypothetical protein
LGCIYQRGFLRCGIAESQTGFAQVNLETGKYEGFDVEMVARTNLIVVGNNTRPTRQCFDLVKSFLFSFFSAER